MVTPLEEIEEEFERPHFDPERDSLGYWDGGRLVAEGHIWFRPSGTRQEKAYLQGRVDPEYRGLGIGRELFRWQFDRGIEILSAVDNDLPRFIRADEWDWIDESHRLYRHFGFAPVRYFAEMIKSLEDLEPPTQPDGVDILPWDRALDDQAMDVINASFAEHWGSTPTDRESFQHRLDGVGTRTDLSYLAMVTGNVVGVALNAHFPEDEGLLGRRDGWVEVLGVLRDYRKRGIATALLETSFVAFRESGLTHSALGVDTANPTDALNLYTQLGYETTHRSITSEIEVSRI
jgi:mycothiol synthase